MNKKATVLIIEDDTPLAMMMVHVLSRAGCDVQVASTGEKGLELAKENRFDLITSDIDLPGISGLEICRELKQRHVSYRTPIILFSGNGTEERRSKAFELGAADFIEKPFKASDFIARIHSSLEANVPA